MIDTSKDAVNHPSHYNAGQIEVIEFIEDQGDGPAFCRGNVIKYTARAGKKVPKGANAVDCELEDLKKARWYLNRLIEIREAAAVGRAPVRPNDMNKPLKTCTTCDASYTRDVKDAWESIKQTGECIPCVMARGKASS